MYGHIISVVHAIYINLSNSDPERWLNAVHSRLHVINHWLVWYSSLNPFGSFGDVLVRVVRMVSRKVTRSSRLLVLICKTGLINNRWFKEFGPGDWHLACVSVFITIRWYKQHELMLWLPLVTRQHKQLTFNVSNRHKDVVKENACCF